GKPVYAIGGGYVSRIKVSTGGYGKVVYITHPDGFVSVYGHLQRFTGALADYVKALQYRKESFVIEAYPDKEALPVRKGDVIAYSGNSGSSSAPHLHFEIREEASQHPVNPLMFNGFEVKDFFRPRILELAVYPVDDASLINGKNDTAFFPVAGWGEEHYLQGNPKIEVSGKVSFGIRTYDPMNDVPNKNGIYTIDFYRDDARVFGLEMNKVSFATTRYLNSLIDYGHYKKEGGRLVRTQVDTNNRLFNYREVINNGILIFPDSTVSTMKYVVKDVKGNTSSLEFVVKSTGNKDYAKRERELIGESDGRFLSFKDSTIYSPVYHVHNRFTPVHKSFSVKIIPEGYADSIAKKLYIAYRDGKGNSWYIGARWDEGWLSAESRLLGDYVVMADTIPPELKPVNISGSSKIKLRISDRETGISRYRGEINGEWVLFEYEPKKNLLEYQPDEHLVAGENRLELTVRDLLGNETVYMTVISR
ncbi:MAG: M23 family metallopeptidase, partial [bacterium]